eukprot:INCI787.1.p1 GENE.INCI787.1~~INCI787.1.p1  ORF type:complete len:101 (+),score=9.15 INCI787.1:219-521(+)
MFVGVVYDRNVARVRVCCRRQAGWLGFSTTAFGGGFKTSALVHGERVACLQNCINRVATYVVETLRTREKGIRHGSGLWRRWRGSATQLTSKGNDQKPNS